MITADQFRKDPELVAQMRALLEQPTMKLWLECCFRASPVNTVAVDPAMTDTISNYMHGAVKGFHLHHNLFISGGTHLVQPTSVSPAAMQLEPEE